MAEVVSAQPLAEVVLDKVGGRVAMALSESSHALYLANSPITTQW